MRSAHACTTDGTATTMRASAEPFELKFSHDLSADWAVRVVATNYHLNISKNINRLTGEGGCSLIIIFIEGIHHRGKAQNCRHEDEYGQHVFILFPF